MSLSELVQSHVVGSDSDIVLVADRSFTRAELQRAVTDVQHEPAFIDAVSTAPLVAVDTTPTAQTITSLLALIELGVPFIPLHTAWSAVQRARVLAATGAVVLDLSTGTVATDGALWNSAAGRHFAPRPRTPDSTLAVVFTSGSTGTPKGVVLQHRAFAASARLTRDHLELDHDEVFHLSLPLAHVGGLAILTRALILGGTLVLPTTTGAPNSGFDPARFVRRCAETACTVVSLVPTQLRRICAAGLTAPASVGVVLLGGAHSPPALVEAAQRLGWKVHRTYGLTEACSQVATDRRGGVEGPLELLPELGARLEPDGRLALRGPTLFAGYWGEDRREQSEWFVTSDLATLGSEGVTPLGRADDLIISGGENIFPDEVDAALASAPGVIAACCFARESKEWGQELCAALIAGPDFDATRLVAHLRAVLPSFKIPKAWALVSEFPTTATGKLSRRSCQRAFAHACQPFQS